MKSRKGLEAHTAREKKIAKYFGKDVRFINDLCNLLKERRSQPHAARLRFHYD
jgi:hypothetical protein